MADRVQRPQAFYYEDYDTKSDAEWLYLKEEADPYMTMLEAKSRNLKSLHADIIDQGRKVQIAASGESKYGAMSDSEFIEWALNLLDGK